MRNTQHYCGLSLFGIRQEMYDETVEEDLCLLEYVPDWFVKQDYIDVWDDDVRR